MSDGLRVLYVDDEPGLLAIAKIFLERTGDFSVEISDSALKVMDSSTIPSYDAIISDYQMPEMDGIEFLKEVRERYGDIPFLLFTGRGREEVVIDAINNGADFYIQKGGDPKAQFAELAHKLRQAITRRRAQVELRIAYETITTSEEKLRGQYAELARSEQMIRESEARFREFAELLPQIVFEVDRRFRVTFANNQGYLQTGYAPEDVAFGFNSLTVIDPSQHARLKDHTERIVRGEHYEHGEYTVIRKDGSTFPALVYGDAVCNGGETTGFRGIIIDISELKRVEDALRESEEKYRLLVEVNQDIFYSLDHNGTILYVGPQVTDQLGFRPEEMAGHNFTEFIHPDDASRHVRSMQDYLQMKSHDGFQIISDQFRVRTQDGLYRWYENKTIDTVDQRGRRVFIGTIRDVTDRKHAEDAVFDSRQMLQTVLDTIPQRVFWKDRDSVFLGCNKSLAHDIGYADPAAVIGKTDYDHSSSAIAEHFRDDDRAVMESGQPKINFEEPQIRPDGSTAWLRTSKVPLRNREGAIIGVLGTYDDITASRRTHEALAESERKYRELSDSLPQMIFETDRDLRIAYANRHAVAVLGFTGEEEFHGTSILSLIDPTQHAEVKDSIRKILEGVPFEPKEYTGIKSDGSRFPVNIYSSPIYRNKTLVGFRGIVVDISAQKKREAVLQASEEKFRALAEHSLDGIVITDFSGNFLFANRAAGSIIDVTDYTLLAGTRNVMEFFAPESQADVRKDFSKVAQGIDAYLVHYKIITALQREAWVECIGKKIPYGDSSAMLVSIRDITERKRVEDALRESESHYRLLADHVHDVIWTSDLDMHITYISPSVKKLRGFTPEEALAEPVSDALTPASFRAATEQNRKIREALQNGKPLPENNVLELEFRCCDGSTVWTESITTLTFDGTGTVNEVVGISRDIRQRREAERALRESENKFSTIFRSSLVALTLISVKDRRFYDVNDAFVRSTGYSRDEVIGKTPDDLELFAEPEAGDLISMLLQSRRLVNGIEVKFRIKNREIQTCLYSASLIRMGEETYVLSNIEDITARKTAEEALRQANRKLTLLSSINRHDINNQLGVLNGFVELLKSKIPDPSCNNYLSRIETSSSQIANLIQFTREYEQIGVQTPLWQDLPVLVEAAGASLEPGRITLINDLPAKVEVFADPLIAKVFSNLIDNAIRHGGPITTIRFSLAEQNGDRIVVCEDDGAGVVPFEKEQIFDLGFGKNTGFGLALSKEILDITGIRISETGEPGKGARFEMVVPNGAYRFTGEKPGPA